LKGKIISNEEISSGYYRLVISDGSLSKESRAGQFIMLKVSQGDSPLLRRPMSISRIDRDADNIEVLYRVVGKGTTKLTEFSSGSEIDILGPLGNGFDIVPNKKAILVGGGIGIAPLIGLADDLKKRNAEPVLMIGGATKNDLIGLSQFKDLNISPVISTDDGSLGKKGFVVGPLLEYISSLTSPDEYIIYSCGPNVMLREVHKIASAASIDCQVSLEGRMGCGLGACLSCVVPDKDNMYVTVCKDGPVFDSGRLSW